jgi:tetratricopeptide (TPR) repeat protein
MVFLLMMTVVVFLIPGLCPGQSDSLTGMDEGDFIHKYKSANKAFETTCKKHLLKGELLKAEKGLLKCQDIMPGHVGSLFYLSYVCYRKKEYNRALEYIRRAKGGYKVITRKIAGIQKHNAHKAKEQQNVLREALDSYRGFESIDGACAVSPIVREMRGEIAKLERSGASVSAAEDPVPAEYFYIHGNILFRLKQYAGARDQYLETVKRDPAHRDAYNNLVNLYYVTRKLKKSLYYLDMAEKNGVPVNPRLKQAVLKASEK